MIPLLAAALLPALYWEQGVETIPALKQAGVECVQVPAGKAAAWRGAGFCHEPAGEREKLPPPGVRWEINEASATRSPWVDANWWRFARGPGLRYLYDLPAGAAALAAAEAFACGVDASLRIDPKDLEAYGRMLAFFKQVDRPPLPVLANIALIDDGSALTGEVMNLLGRRNLLFRVVAAPDPAYDLNVRIGSEQYPKAEAADPSAFANKIRRQLTDEKRLLRIFGSNVVLGRLTGDAARARLHLLNYGGEKIDGLRVRVLGTYSKGQLAAAGFAGASLQDYTLAAGGAEFTIPAMGVYAVVDLER